MNKVKFAFAFTMCMCGSASAEQFYKLSFLDGNKLLEMCDTAPAVAAAYIVGSWDQWAPSVNVVNRYFGLEEYKLCIPSDIKAEDMKNIVCREIQNNPGQRSQPAYGFVERSLTKAYACSSS